MSHDLSPRPLNPAPPAPHFPWPGGKRSALFIGFDVDAETAWIGNRPENVDRMVTTSHGGYDARVGIAKVLELLDDLGLKATFFIPGWTAEAHTAACEPIVAAGHEIGHHGYLHESPVGQSRDEQAGWMDRAIEVIVRATGQRPRGWRAPLYNFSDHSAGLLVERGFRYDASLMGDDVPYMIEAAGGSLVEIPSHWGLDDWPQWVQSMDLDYMMPIRAPEAGWQPFMQEFESAYRHGGLWVPVVHPFATGRLSRWEVVAGFLEAVLARGDVWFAPMEEIAQHVQSVSDSGVYTPRRVAMPQYSAPVRASL